MRSVSFSRTRPSLTRARACSWRALLRLALATLVVLSLATPALARAGVHPASNGATLSAEVDAKKPVARLNPRPGITVRAPATPRPVPLPPTRSCDVAAAGRGSLETAEAFDAAPRCDQSRVSSGSRHRPRSESTCRSGGYRSGPARTACLAGMTGPPMKTLRVGVKAAAPSCAVQAVMSPLGTQRAAGLPWISTVGEPRMIATGGVDVCSRQVLDEYGAARWWHDVVFT